MKSSSHFVQPKYLGTRRHCGTYEQYDSDDSVVSDDNEEDEDEDNFGLSVTELVRDEKTKPVDPEIKIESLHCPICREVFYDVRTLWCGHSFCFSCLENWKKKSGRKDFACPMCKCKAFLPPQKSVDLENSAETAFPTEYKNRVEAFSRNETKKSLEKELREEIRQEVFATMTNQVSRERNSKKEKRRYVNCISMPIGYMIKKLSRGTTAKIVLIFCWCISICFLLALAARKAGNLGELLWAGGLISLCVFSLPLTFQIVKILITVNYEQQVSRIR